MSSEIDALATAVDAATSLSKYGNTVRVVAIRGGYEFTEFVAMSFAQNIS